MKNGEQSPCVVNIAFKRIQQFLFAVPRLKAMIGANALLGEAIRKDLVELVTEGGDYIDITSYAGIDFKAISESNIFSIDADVLNGNTANELNADNPLLLYEKGIISRDGGHFTAAFKDDESAQNFILKTQKLVSNKLPGVQIEVKPRRFDGVEVETRLAEGSWGESPVRLPQFQICQDTGSEIANTHNKNSSPEYTSNRVKTLEAKADKFKKGETEDIIGLLINKGDLPGYSSMHNIPDDLEDLAGKSGYIAVIHADGNGMGVRRKLYAGASDVDRKQESFEAYLQKELKNEQFFYAMRTAVRTSVVTALEQTFTAEVRAQHKKLPYHLLMLGGDDLLIITQPQYAFSFITEYSKQLKARSDIPYKDDNSFKSISIGAGIAIAHKNVPFYHLYTLAENLSESAKKLYRSQYAGPDESPEENSVIDWMVATTSWVDDIQQIRSLYELSPSGDCCTTAKPYFILEEDTVRKAAFNLESLWDAALSIQQRLTDEADGHTGDRDKLARSQFKNLLQSITKFDRETSEKTYVDRIQPKPQQFIDLFAEDGSKLWESIGTLADTKYLTQYKDLIELIELFYLGQQTVSNRENHTAEEVTVNE